MKTSPDKKRLVLEITPEQHETLQEKMASVGMTNFSVYARKMLLDGYIVKRDFSQIKELTHELANLARSINQIAKRVNETRSIYETDVKELQEMYGKAKAKISENLMKTIKEDE